jgi:4-aminobutyrate aminotransferase-like enzyme/Ser/Thr protein kinase RdoA (MazF antagonist)/murein DD-endopeptidase MepM/ murein hydrolase activator NlpD
MFAVVQNRPQFTASDGARLARELFGISGDAQELPSERDQNFYLNTESGEKFVLKIASAADSIEVLDLQNKAMAHIAAQAPSILCPRVCPALSREQTVCAEGPGGRSHFLRMLTWLPGRFFAHVRPHTSELLRSLGRLFGQMDRALAGFSHPAAQRTLKWDLRDAGRVIRAGLDFIQNREQRALIEHFLGQFETKVVPALPAMRTSVIHNDGNDLNILVTTLGAEDAEPGAMSVSGIIDFGDMLNGITASEPAIAAAYALLGKANPIAAAAHVISGYHEAFALTEPEISLLYHLICTRLATSVAVSAVQQKEEPDKPYLSVSERQAWEALERLAALNPQLAHYTFRAACGLPPCPHRENVVRWLRDHWDRIGPVVEPDLNDNDALFFDLSVGSLELGNLEELADVKSFTNLLFGRMHASGATVGIAGYNEARPVYTSEPFRSASDEIESWRTVHLGIDLFQEPGSPVFAPLDGSVHSSQDNAAPLDYGPTIILEHSMDAGRGKFFTLYGHLTPESLDGLRPGLKVEKGSRIGKIGNFPGNGGWPPHVHFQIICDLLGRCGDFPGVAPPEDRAVWLSLCPDPNLVLGIDESRFPKRERSAKEILAARHKSLGRSLSVSYRRPLKIVRGFMQYLYDDEGRRYLDAVNNVPHVGHSHPRVVGAAQRQAAVLNTNTRYLHENLVRYAERLSSLLPEPLRVCFFVNSGSEANDLALRLARTHTRRKDVVVVDGAYHGNLTSLVEISPYKFDGPGGSGALPHIHKVPMPDVYRGLYRSNDLLAGVKYAAHVREAIRAAGEGVAAFICESVLSCGGQIVLPPGYLQEVYRQMRAAGAVCIADEVQVGFGRLGSHFWGFETQDVVPDIVTMGKPIGNGHPLGAVVTTPEIAASFATGMEYFNTYGGNPVSCAAGLAVLDVIEEEGLQTRALRVGARLKSGIEQLAGRHPLIGDVRGLGLFLGMELVRERQTLEPAAAEASYLIERMKDHGILVSTDGPLHNVIKIKPPLVFSESDADFFVRTLDKILAEDFLAKPATR